MTHILYPGDTNSRPRTPTQVGNARMMHQAPGRIGCLPIDITALSGWHPSRHHRPLRFFPIKSQRSCPFIGVFGILHYDINGPLQYNHVTPARMFRNENLLECPSSHQFITFAGRGKLRLTYYKINITCIGWKQDYMTWSVRYVGSALPSLVETVA